MSLLLEYIENHPKETKRLIDIHYEQLQQLFTQASALRHQKQTEMSFLAPFSYIWLGLAWKAGG